MRLWVINLKKKIKIKTYKNSMLPDLNFKTLQRLKKKKEPINLARNIWKIQLLKLYNPSRASMSPTPVDLNDYRGN